MMREVVDNRHAAHLRPNLQPALHTAKTAQRLHDRCRLDSLPRRQRRGSRRIQCVMLAGHRQRQLRKRSARSQQRPLGRRPLVPKTRQLPHGALLKTVPLHRAEGSRDTLCHSIAAIVSHQPPAPRNQVDEPHEGGFHGTYVGINIGVIELHVRQDRAGRKIVQELRTLIEESCVVLVSLDHKRQRRPHPKARPEVLRHASNQERRRELRP